MRVCVLGHRGMLGHVVARYLHEQGCTVSTVPGRFDADNPAAFLRAIEVTQPAWCINCIGLRPGPAVTSAQLFATNTLLPQLCAQTLQGRIGFVHASSDGIFRPDLPSRSVAEAGDATDGYGVSKWQAEQAVLGAGGLILRCSILGPELGAPRSLLGWLLRQTGTATGYTNHCWNGLTTLEWARVCWERMNGRWQAEGSVLQPGTWPARSKYEVLLLIARIWNLQITIQPVAAPLGVERTLLPTLKRPDLEEQLRELKAWY